MELAGRDFEDEVRRVARQLWPQSQYAGAAIEDGRERDGVFETEWMVHLIEATTWRTKDKAQHDIAKLVKLRRRLLTRGKPVQCWFITQSEPTADQRGVAPGDSSVNVLSFEQFRSKLIDAAAYLRDRDGYAFGSARDPESGGFKVREKYLPLEAVSSDGKVLTVEKMADTLNASGRLVILGDYGAGKSMTLRELFSRLAMAFRRSTTAMFPIHLNLRDHHAQSEPAEALERHARSIGFADPSQLVRAWRAGYAHLLLDGFDEMASPGWGGPSTRMRLIRRRSVELVRRFIRETPKAAGIAIVGREHYFDSPGELMGALGTESFTLYRLRHFSEDQIQEYLESHGWDGGLPDWVPARPLLISYLASRNLLREALDVPAGSSPAAAWDALLSLICSREAEIEANIDGNTVRTVVEALASVARTRTDGLGPLEFHDIEAAFRSVCCYAPDDRAMVLLQRLPGLGPLDPESGTRRFIDEDLADAARAGDIIRYAKDPFTDPPHQSAAWTVGMRRLGVDIAAQRLAADAVPVTKVIAAARKAAADSEQGYLASDVVRIVAAMGGSLTDGTVVFLSGLWLDEIELDDPGLDLSGAGFQDCVFEVLDIPRDGTPEHGLPHFRRSHFGMVEGRTSARDLPADRFLECTFDSFAESGDTTSQLLSTSLPIGQRVGLTILRKLYMQRGSGRKENAFLRGLGQAEQMRVSQVLDTLRKHGLAVRSQVGRERVWIPARRATARVHKMIEGPTTCEDDAWVDLINIP